MPSPCFGQSNETEVAPCDLLFHVQHRRVSLAAAHEVDFSTWRHRFLLPLCPATPPEKSARDRLLFRPQDCLISTEAAAVHCLARSRVLSPCFQSISAPLRATREVSLAPVAALELLISSYFTARVWRSRGPFLSHPNSGWQNRLKRTELCCVLVDLIWANL